jgi:hypothetical protein
MLTIMFIVIPQVLKGDHSRQQDEFPGTHGIYSGNQSAKPVLCHQLKVTARSRAPPHTQQQSSRHNRAGISL